MPLLEDVADKLAARTLALMEASGDEELEQKVAQEIGTSSPTLQEAFSTALRIRKAELRAVRFIDKFDSQFSTTSKSAPPEPEEESVIALPVVSDIQDDD